MDNEIKELENQYKDEIEILNSNLSDVTKIRLIQKLAKPQHSVFHPAYGDNVNYKFAPNSDPLNPYKVTCNCDDQSLTTFKRLREFKDGSNQVDDMLRKQK